MGSTVVLAILTAYGLYGREIYRDMEVGLDFAKVLSLAVPPPMYSKI